MIGFRVQMNGVAPTGFTQGEYSLLPWALADINVGSRFVFDEGDCWWEPVQGEEDPALVWFGGGAWIKETQVAAGVVPNNVVRIIKNGDEDTGTTIAACVGVPMTNFKQSVSPFAPNTFFAGLTALDLAQPGDRYRTFIYTNGADTKVDAHILKHTHWWGARP